MNAYVYVFFFDCETFNDDIIFKTTCLQTQSFECIILVDILQVGTTMILFCTTDFKKYKYNA